ncbi:MAG TPA: glycosyltransferase [Mycobacterium sp.]
MRILHVVTLISPDGAYGGPVRVATNQAAELRRQGHDVTIAAATRGYGDPPREAEGTPLRLFRAHRVLPRSGFAGLSAPALLRWLRDSLRDFDVVHVHLARDLVTLPAAALARRWAVPYVAQTHGMVIPSDRRLASILDRACTRRVLRSAGFVFYLTGQERSQLVGVGGAGLRLAELRNGVPLYETLAVRNGGPAEVVYVARLHPRKQPKVFVAMAHTLLAEGFDARFTLVGPDEGEGDAVLAAIGFEPRIRWEGAVDPGRIPGRLGKADIFVLPAVREPYPMGVLEAMSVGLPVVVAEDCGLADTISKTRSGIVARADVSGMTAAVRVLLVDPESAQRMGERGRRTVAEEFTMSAIADTLLRAYNQARRVKA